MQALIDSWFEAGREAPRRYRALTRDGWRLALYRYSTPRGSHRTPVILCHGMSSNRWNMDGPGRTSMARYLARKGYDVWVVELRGAGRSMRPNWWNQKAYDWRFEDYVYHDAPAVLRVVLRETGAEKVHWVGHSMGGMIAYALLMGPVQTKIASAVTLASPTMSEVGHPMLDFGLPFRSLLRFAPSRVPIGLASRLGAPWALLIHWLFQRPIAELGFHAGSLDPASLRALMFLAIDDLPASLLREFARWYETKAMSDRYAMFDFTEHLERVSAPLFIIAGGKDELTPARDLEYVYDHIASRDKAFRVIGKEHGFAHDYSHADLVLGKHAPDDVYPLILEWLDARRERTPKEQARGARLHVVRDPGERQA